jgi:hypothetical protein
MNQPNIPDRFAIEQEARELRRAEIARLTNATVEAALAAAERSVVAIARVLRRARLAHRSYTAPSQGHALAH